MRPIKLLPGLVSPLKNDQIDFVFIRENSEGGYSLVLLTDSSLPGRMNSTLRKRISRERSDRGKRKTQYKYPEKGLPQNDRFCNSPFLLPGWNAVQLFVCGKTL